MRIARVLAPTLLTLLFASTAHAGDAPPLTDMTFMELDTALPSLRGRPNEEYRVLGLKAYGQRHYDDAIRRFDIAAQNADKYSQHYLSLMHWYGVGTPVDRVQAYIWSDLAAERGSPRLLAIRERMWAQLSSQEQARARDEGVAYYERYGDEVAKPRAEAEIRRFARNMTGSRVGYRSQWLDTVGAPVNGVFNVGMGSNASAYAISDVGREDELYGKEGGLRRLQTYWQEQDRLLDGSVEVGEMQTARSDRRNP